MNRIKLITAIVLAFTACNVVAAEDLPKGVTLIAPADMKWVNTASGRDQAYLLGHPSKPGPYLYLVKWPPNSKALAH